MVEPKETTNIAHNSSKQWLRIAAIIFAGEMIFSLPFHLARFFRPTFLSSFELTNTQLGDIFAFYGVVAMLAYFPGGYLADRFSARKLMTAALYSTAAGGLYLASFPSLSGLTALFAFWGLTTILCFWSAMIKMTRDVTASDDQGKAFGLLDGGRGFVAASMATLAVYLLGVIFPEQIANLSTAERLDAMQIIIYYYTGLTFFAGVLVWLIIPDSHSREVSEPLIGTISQTLMDRRLWLQAAVVFCAYCGFKGLDYFGLYLVKVYDYNEIKSSEVIAYSSYIRPITAVLAGILADRFSPSRVLAVMFIASACMFLLLTSVGPVLTGTLLVTTILLTFTSVFALRAVYFALIEETQIARHMTGVSVGVISVIGFTPDIFFAPYAGRLLDNPNAITGFNHFFTTLIILSLVGLISTYMIRKES